MDGRLGQMGKGSGQAVDALVLLEQFERFVTDAPRVPLTGKLVIDEEDLFGFLDQLRRILPEEIQRAREVIRERQRIVEEAQARAEALVEEARRRVERMVDESVVLRQAEEEAEKLLGRVRHVARQVRAEADSYADDVLARVEAFLQRALEQVRDGRSQLRPHADPGEGNAAEEAAVAQEGRAAPVRGA